MKEKIKNLFGFLSRAWSGGWRGKLGIACAFLAMVMFVRIFFGDVTIQKIAYNIWQLKHEQQELVLEHQKLDTINRHIELIQNYSPDYVEELGLKYLNIGDPGVKILKI